MQCDICGKNKDSLKKAIVEGTLLSVCDLCSSYGIEVKKHEVKREQHPSLKIYQPKDTKDLVEDFALKIKKAREFQKLSQRDLAMAIAEKESVINKIETSYITPPMNTAKKLEQFLKIKLIKEKEEQVKQESVDFKNKGLTVGDIIKLKNDNKK